MKKRIISILMATVMVMTMLPTTVFAETEHPESDHTGWTVWTATDCLPTKAGNYYLGNDVNLKNFWKVPEGTTNLCLNGKVIRQTKNDSSVISILSQQTTLNLYDCGNDKHYYSAEDGLWVLTETDTGEYVTGGVITGGNNDSGAGVNVYSGTFTMNGGNIIGNEGALGNNGAGVYVSNGTFTLNSGAISGNKTKNDGGGVDIRGTANFTMNGGIISDNTAEQKGGGVYIGDGTNFTMNGGIISDNTAKQGGGVYNNGTITLGGDAKIISNTDINENTNNLYLVGDKTISFCSGNDVPKSEMSVGVTLENGSGIFTTGGTDAYVNYFTSDNPNYDVNFVESDSNYLELKIKETSNYSVNIAPCENGNITIDKETAEEGETVTVTVNPADGYRFKSLTGIDMSFVTVDPSGTTAPNVDANAAGFGGSTVRNGNFFGHNFDYYINDKKEVVIKTEANSNRPHATIGVANPYSLDVTGTAYNEETLKQLAWLITDGINDAGLACSINGVSTADIKDKLYSHTNNGAPEVMVLHLVRAILDNCGTVEEAKTFIESHDITPLSADWDAHIMIADAENTVIVEFTGEGVKFVEQSQWIMTDFYNHKFKEENYLKNDSFSYLPNHPIGRERYDLLKGNYNISNSIQNTMDLLQMVSYTKTYDENVDPFWCSEFFRTDMIPTFDERDKSYWIKGIVKEQDAPKSLIEKYAAYKENGTYTPDDDPAKNLKHTAHSSVYNIKDKTLTLSFGDDQKYIYTFDGLTNPEITPTKQTDGTYSFSMPDYDVTVIAEFDKIYLYTVTFDGLEHNVKVASGERLNKPDSNPEKPGYTFGGWYSDEACTQAWNFAVDTVTGDMTLYPKWIENSVQKASITGNVKENNGAVSNATVELFLGIEKVAATVTDENGGYGFENVENGTYNIVVTKEDGKTKTEMVTINNSSATIDVELPNSNISSKVEHNKGSDVSNAKIDISKTVVGGLDKVAEKHKPNNDEKVVVKLTVEPKADTNTTVQQAIKTEAGNGKKVEFLDLSLLMQTDDETPVDIGNENDVLLTIVIPFDFTDVDVTSIMILRNHGGKTEKLSSEKNENEEYIEINKEAGTITLNVKKFSDYAIAYDMVNEGEQDNPQYYPGNNKSSSGGHEYITSKDETSSTANNTESTNETNPSTGAGIVPAAFILAAFVPTLISGKNHF